MVEKDYKEIFHIVSRKDGNLVYYFVIIGDTVSHFRDVLNDEVKYQNVPSLVDFCVRRGYRCFCDVSPDADEEVDEDMLEAGAGFATKFVNSAFDAAGILFTEKDLKMYQEAIEDEDFRNMFYGEL